MKTLLSLSAAALLLTTSCGYHLGGLRPSYMKSVDSVFVEVFANHTTQPNLSVQFTTALANSLQADGTYKLKSRSTADAVIRGEITNIVRSSLRSNSEDSYVSAEVGLTITVNYTIEDRKTGRVLTSGKVTGQGSNLSTTGNVQAAVDNALSAAARRAADDLMVNLSMP